LNILTLGAAAGGSMGLMIFVVIMFVGMYFISIRPQKKQQQKRKEMLSEMQKGDKVVTLGGIKGVVSSINRDNKEVVVDCDGIYLTFDLNFIRRTTPAADAKTEEAKTTDTKAVEADTKADSKEDAPKSDDTTKETEAKAEPKVEEPKAAADVKDAEPAKDDTKDETK